MQIAARAGKIPRTVAVLGILVAGTGLEFARRPYQALPARTKQYQKALCYKGLGRSVVPTRTKAKQPVTTY